MPEQHDWRSADAYAYLDDAEPAVFAWEFLRRNAEYQQTYRSVSGEADASPELSRSQARRWGLRFAADPDLRADRACVVWLPELNPATVVVAPAPAAFTEASPISGLTPSFSRRATDGVYWLVEFESTRLPVVLIDGANAAAPAAVVLPLDGNVPMRIEAARRLSRAVSGRDRDRPADPLTPQQRARLGLTLRSLDGRLAGYSYRDIARALFPTRVPRGSLWKTHDLKDRTRRLCSRGIDLMRGGYLNLLKHPRRFRA